jgi:hypothetical protein
MDAAALIADFQVRGIRLIPAVDRGLIFAKPSDRLTDIDRANIRRLKPALMEHLRARAESAPTAAPERASTARQGRPEAGDDFQKPARPEVTPDARTPLLSPAVRSTLEGIEAEARNAGWPAELIWGADFWGKPRGLGSVLDDDDVIAEITAECITILKTKRDVLTFRRHIA